MLNLTINKIICFRVINVSISSNFFNKYNKINYVTFVKNFKSKFIINFQNIHILKNNINVAQINKKKFINFKN